MSLIFCCSVPGSNLTHILNLRTKDQKESVFPDKLRNLCKAYEEKDFTTAFVEEYQIKSNGSKLSIKETLGLTDALFQRHDISFYCAALKKKNGDVIKFRHVMSNEKDPRFASIQCCEGKTIM
jgi:hypothetical protein